MKQSSYSYSPRVLNFPFFLVLIVALFLTQSVLAQTAEVVTNQTVVKLQKAGISNDVIATKINNSPCNFDLSADGIIALKKDSVNDDIIKVMIARGSTVVAAQPATSPVTAPPVVAPVKTVAEPVQDVTTAQANAKAAELKLAPGLYYFNPTTNDYTEIDATPLTKGTEGGVSGKVTGLFNGKAKMNLRGIESNLIVGPGKPMFVFVFDTDNSTNKAHTAPVQNPNDYYLVQFAVGKSDREVTVKKGGGDGFQGGIDDSAKLPFHYKRIQRGLYEITAAAPMPTGEFSFILPSTAPDQSTVYNAYDFSVQ